MKKYKITQDNGWCNGNKKLTVITTIEEINVAYKEITRKRKDITAEQFFKFGSYMYDKIIERIYRKRGETKCFQIHTISR